MAKTITKELLLKNLKKLSVDDLVRVNNSIASIDGTTEDIWQNDDEYQMAGLFRGIYGHTTREMCRAIMFGDYRSADRYYTIGRDGNIYSFNDYKEHLSVDEIAEWFVLCYEEDDHESADEIAREYNLYEE